MKQIIISLLLLFSIVGKADVIAKPSVEQLVNDFAGVMDRRMAQTLEDSLVAFSNRTSTQVLVITVGSLDGYSASEYAYKIGQEWGVGQKGKNNGIVILVKPKTADSRGEAFIASGYGLEGALPDVVCTRIVNNVMIPHFKENDYQSGIVSGAIAVMQFCEGEFTGDALDDEDDAITVIVFFMFVIFVVIVLLVLVDQKGNDDGGSHMSSGRSLSDAAWMASMLSGSRSSSSSWGSFSGGSGSFGGFGGGSFGGGGGGGSW